MLKRELTSIQEKKQDKKDKSMQVLASGKEQDEQHLVNESRITVDKLEQQSMPVD